MAEAPADPTPAAPSTAADAPSPDAALAALRAELAAERAGAAACAGTLAACQELVAALQAKLAQVEKHRDAFEKLSRGLQEAARASQEELKAEAARREEVHGFAQSLLGKFDAGAQRSAQLEAERGALAAREAALVQRVAALEESLSVEARVRELQGKLVEATTAEAEAVKADRLRAVEELAAARGELEAARERARVYAAEVKDMGPKLTALSEDFNRVLVQQKEASEKVRLGWILRALPPNFSHGSCARDLSLQALGALQEERAALLTRLASSDSQLLASLREQTATMGELGLARKHVQQLSTLCRSQQAELKKLRGGGGGGGGELAVPAAPALSIEAAVAAANAVD